MSATTDLDWLFTALGVLLGAGGLILGAWALFWDRAKRRGVVRRRCPKCWYDMAGVPGLTCPECGNTAKHERRLVKTRRRWGWTGVAAVLLMGAYALAITPAVRDHGWPRAVPNAVLIAALPWFESPVLSPLGRTTPSIRQRLFSELLDHRVVEGHLCAWERRWLIRKCIREKHTGITSTTEWSIFYGLIFDNLVREAEWTRLPDRERQFRYGRTPTPPTFALTLNDRDWDLLSQSRVRSSISARTRWPSGVALRVGMDRDWFKAPTRSRALTVAPRFSTACSITTSVQSDITHVSYGIRTWNDHTIVLGVPPEGVRELILDAALTEGPGWEATDPVWSGTIRVPISVGGTPEEIVRPVSVPELDAALVADLTPAVRYYEGTPGELFITLGVSNGTRDPPGPTLRALASHHGLALAVRIELLRDGAAVATTAAWWSANTEPTGESWLSPGRTIVQPEILDPQALASRASGEWTLRVAGDAVVALRCPTCDSFWKGELVVPVTWSSGADTWD